MDRTLIAAQVGRLYVEAAAAVLNYGAVPFPAVFEDYVPPVTDTDRNVGNDTVIVVKAARAVFGSTLPRQSQHFSDATRLYRILELPSMPPTDPVIKFVCAVSPLA